MRKLLLITTALVCLGTAPVQAGPVAPVIAAGLTSLGVGATFATAIAGAIVSFATSVVLSYVAAAIMGKPKGASSSAQQQEIRSELRRPTGLPAYRFAYGHCSAPGTPVGWRVVGRVLYICYLLNSRPSSLPSHSLLIDKRGTDRSGDPFNFGGPGATVTNGPFDSHMRYWIGRGDQTSCPGEIVGGAGGEFVATDAWRGRTVLWARIDRGPDETASDRWLTSPPEIDVIGDWSLVWDPRDGATRHTRNQALIVLDALRTNPIRPYTDPYLWLDTFKWAANVAGQGVPTKSGDWIPRYHCDGLIVWAQGAELEDQIEPLLAAGGSRLARVGGLLSMIPAVERDAVHTVTEFSRGQDVEMRRWQPSDQIYTECVATYTAPDRSYEAAEAPVYIVGGAQAEDGGLAKRLDLQLEFVTDARQAQRLAKIAVMRSRMQREVSGELFPDAFDLVAGSVCNLSLAGPWAFANGRYEVASIHPAAAVNADQSITLRLPVTLREDHPSIYAWDPATEEGDIAAAPPLPVRVGMQPPATVTASTGGGAALISGGVVTPRVQIDWPASVSPSTIGYEWQYRIASGVWISGGTVTTSGQLRAWIAPAQVGSVYQIRVRAYGPYGASIWRESSPVTASGPDDALAPPEILLAVGRAAAVDLTVRQASDAAASALEIWTSLQSDPDTAALLVTIPAGASVTVTHTHAGLGPAETHRYWSRARNGFGAASPLSAVATATTTP